MSNIFAPVCPECAAGKHRNCDGTALYEATDEIGPCACTVCRPSQAPASTPKMVRADVRKRIHPDPAPYPGARVSGAALTAEITALALKVIVAGEAATGHKLDDLDRELVVGGIDLGAGAALLVAQRRGLIVGAAADQALTDDEFVAQAEAAGARS